MKAVDKEALVALAKLILLSFWQMYFDLESISQDSSFREEITLLVNRQWERVLHHRAAYSLKTWEEDEWMPKDPGRLFIWSLQYGYLCCSRKEKTLFPGISNELS